MTNKAYRIEVISKESLFKPTDLLEELLEEVNARYLRIEDEDTYFIWLKKSDIREMERLIPEYRELQQEAESEEKMEDNDDESEEDDEEDDEDEDDDGFDFEEEDYVPDFDEEEYAEAIEIIKKIKQELRGSDEIMFLVR